MLKKISERIVQIQYENHRIQKEEIQVYRYGYYLLMEVVINFLLGIICGIIFDAIVEVLIFWIIYIPLRKYCGGWHAQKDWVCSIVSTTVLALSLIWVNYYICLSEKTKGCITIIQMICAIGILVLAPVETTNKKLNLSEKKIYKMIVIMIVLVYILLAWRWEYVRAMIIFSFFTVFIAMFVEILSTAKVIKGKNDKNKLI